MVFRADKSLDQVNRPSMDQLPSSRKDSSCVPLTTDDTTDPFL